METDIPYGYCQCGCGKKTVIADYNDKSKGWLKGQPLRFINGHNLKQRGKQISKKAIGNKGLSSHGYVRVQTEQGRRYEHILIAEKILGRSLKYFGPGHPQNEIVHHKDGNRQNNDPNNLLILTHAAHTALHKSSSTRRPPKCQSQ